MEKKSGPGPRNYLVGKGRPPQSTRWKRGQSGNPKGRPKGTKNIKTCLRRELAKKIRIRESGRTREVTVREGIAINITRQGLRADPKLLPLIISLDREISEEQEHQYATEIHSGMSDKEALDAFREMLENPKMTLRPQRSKRD